MNWISDQVRALEQRAQHLEQENQELKAENARLRNAAKAPASDEGLVDVAAAAEFLDIGKSTIYGLMDSGHLRYVKIGSARRIPKRELRALVEANMKGGWALSGQEDNKG